MTQKKIIIALSSLLAVSYVGFFVYQRIQRKKSDNALDSYEEALEKLREAKESAAPLYTKPDLESLGSEYETTELPAALTDDYGQPKILTF